MKIAFVHEYLNQFGGAERMLQVLCSLFPDAPIYTLIYDENATQGVFKNRVIRTSFLDKVPFAKRHHYLFPLLMPLAIEQFDFSDYDVVLSISASFAKGIITKPWTKHICYCLTPTRFLWDDSQNFIKNFSLPRLIKKLAPPFLSYLRIWDQEASLRVDEFWAVSDFVKDRIKKYYLKNSQVIYPPVDVSKFKISDKIDDYFLMIGRLVAYKKFDVAIGAFNKLGLPLKVVGIGPELKNLKKIAEKNIEFIGLVDDDKLAYLYSHAKALVFPQEEDFGIVPLEAMASGRPVIAYQGGGAVETIISSQTGLFFDEQNEGALIKIIQKFDHSKFDPQICRRQAEEFDLEVFKKNILNKLK